MNRPAKFLILFKHWGYDNFELNWFHGLPKSRAIPFSQVSADSFRFNTQKCSRSLYAFIAFRPTCFARLVMRNLHETATQRARELYPDSKNNSRRITCGIGCVWGMPSPSPLSSLDDSILSHFFTGHFSWQSNRKEDSFACYIMPQCWLWLDWWTKREGGNKRSRYLHFISLRNHLMMSYCHPLRRLFSHRAHYFIVHFWQILPHLNFSKT